MPRKTRHSKRRPRPSNGGPPRQIIVQHADLCQGCPKTFHKGSAAWWKCGVGLSCLNCLPSYL